VPSSHKIIGCSAAFTAKHDKQIKKPIPNKNKITLLCILLSLFILRVALNETKLEIFFRAEGASRR
jgi:hypothetical protein